jgi:hypothetical protein
MLQRLFLSDNCSKYFGRQYHPSSGAQTTVTTASGNSYTVIDRVKFTDKECLQIRLKLKLFLIIYVKNEEDIFRSETKS